MKQAIKQLAADEHAMQHSTIMRHLSAFQANDLQAVLADYNRHAVLITREATYTGKAAIRAFFEALVLHFPAAQTSFTLHQVTGYKNVIMIIWEASTPTLSVLLGTDTFIIHRGKIIQQTFAAHITYH